MTDRSLSVPGSDAIAARATAAGVTLSESGATALEAHARAVLAANDRLHLTAITDPGEFLERHLGEAFEGAALLPAGITGSLVDLGSGNGYPGIPLAVARPGLVPFLVERSIKKAAFLREALALTGLGAGGVIERSVERASDLAEVETVRVLTARAMGGWERIVPKLRSSLASEAVVLIWGGDEAPSVFARKAWSPFELESVARLPGRQRSNVFALRARGPS